MAAREAVLLVTFLAFCVFPGVPARAQEKLVRVEPQGDTPLVKLELPCVDGAITLQLPELISDTDRRLAYFFSNLKSGVEWQRKADGTLGSAWRQEGLAAYQLTALSEKDGLALDWTITNLGRDVWTDAAGTVCMRSHEVPSLFDPTGERTFLRRRGRWITVRETREPDASTWYLPPGREPLNLMRPLLAEGGWKLSGFNPDEAIMAVRSRDGQWVLAQAWHQARYLIGNMRANYACTDVCPALGNIAPGETVRLQGKIYFFRGSLKDLASKYKADLKTGRIVLRLPR